jgi:DNA-3-methyladenine glycosylase
MERRLGSFSVLTSKFFNRDPRRVARSLLGKLLVRKTPQDTLIGRIVETEAYLGEGDAAAHAVSGKTARNFVLFGPPGYAYVYFIYGSYFCLNVSCLPDGIPGGVLFRALEPLTGLEEMAAARGIKLVEPDGPRLQRHESAARKQISLLRSISSGPGRMCEAFGITRERDNGKDLTSSRSDLQLADDGYRVARVAVTLRVGISKSADELLRYAIAGNAFVSGPKLR